MKDQPNGKLTKVEFEMALDQLQEVMPLMIAQSGQQAKLLKAKFDALRCEGFTDKEALHIVSTRPLYE